MASLDRLPADQKAVLSLVLQRGRTFDEIAALLSIDRAAVRQRALEGFDALGPDTTLDPLRRALITDYLLGQLPTAVADSVRTSLARNPPERAWARVIAAEISPLAAQPLPEIPAPGDPGATAAPRDSADLAALDTDLAETPVGPRAGTGAAATAAAAGAGAASEGPAISRRGGAILLGLIGLVIVVVVVVLLVAGGSAKHHTAAKQPAALAPSGTGTGTTGASATTPAASGTGTGTTQVKPLHQINLVSPSGVKGREGAADVVQAGTKIGLVIVAEGLTANTTNAYAVWLYDSKTAGSKFLGFYNQKVTGTGKTKGQLEAEVALPAGATAYDQLLVTVETVQHPSKPGTTVLEGPFAE